MNYFTEKTQAMYLYKVYVLKEKIIAQSTSVIKIKNHHLRIYNIICTVSVLNPFFLCLQAHHLKKNYAGSFSQLILLGCFNNAKAPRKNPSRLCKNIQRDFLEF